MSFNITIAVLEEYLKRKVLTCIDGAAISKLSLLFYMDDGSLNKMNKNLTFKEALNDNYTLDDIAQTVNNKKARNLYLLYNITFDDETVFPDLLKTLPNGGFINPRMIPKLTRKIKKSKEAKNQVFNRAKNEKSMFSLFNNSKIYDNTLAALMNNPTDTINCDQCQPFNSNNFESKKSSVSFARMKSEANSQKQNSSNFLLCDFQNIGKLINSSEIDIKKIDPSTIKNIKEEEQDKDKDCNKGDEKEDSDNPNIGNSMQFVNTRRENGEISNATKNSVKYEEGLAMLYDKIKTFN